MTRRTSVTSDAKFAAPPRIVISDPSGNLVTKSFVGSNVTLAPSGSSKAGAISCNSKAGLELAVLRSTSVS